MKYAFPCEIARDLQEERETGREAYIITFPDVPEAITCGWSWNEALDMAQDVLDVSLGFRVQRDEDIPKPGLLKEGQVLIELPIITAAKLALYASMRRQGISRAELAARLQTSEEAARRVVDPKYRSHISHIEKALRSVGHSLVVEDKAGV